MDARDRPAAKGPGLGGLGRDEVGHHLGHQAGGFGTAQYSGGVRDHGPALSVDDGPGSRRRREDDVSGLGTPGPGIALLQLDRVDPPHLRRRFGGQVVGRDHRHPGALQHGRLDSGARHQPHRTRGERGGDGHRRHTGRPPGSMVSSLNPVCRPPATSDTPARRVRAAMTASAPGRAGRAAGRAPTGHESPLSGEDNRGSGGTGEAERVNLALPQARRGESVGDQIIDDGRAQTFVADISG